MYTNISSSNLSTLPPIKELKRICQSIAVLDCILEPDYEFRYYSYNSKWDNNEELASMRDGSGDSCFILFTMSGAIIKGFVHESLFGNYAISKGEPWPNIYNSIPDEFKEFISEPAFSINNVSFCIWQRHTDTDWNIGDIQFPSKPDPDGSEEILSIYDGNPETYKKWAESYYEAELDLHVIGKIYEHLPLSSEVVKTLNSERSLNDILDDIEEIGYPLLS